MEFRRELTAIEERLISYGSEVDELLKISSNGPADKRNNPQIYRELYRDVEIYIEKYQTEKGKLQQYSQDASYQASRIRIKRSVNVTRKALVRLLIMQRRLQPHFAGSAWYDIKAQENSVIYGILHKSEELCIDVHLFFLNFTQFVLPCETDYYNMEMISALYTLRLRHEAIILSIR